MASCITASRPVWSACAGMPSGASRDVLDSQNKPLASHALEHVSPSLAQNQPALGGGGGADGGKKFEQKHNRCWSAYDELHAYRKSPSGCAWACLVGSRTW